MCFNNIEVAVNTCTYTFFYGNNNKGLISNSTGDQGFVAIVSN